MLPILASIVSGLISNGLPRVADAVLEKGLDAVEEKLGVKLKPKDEASPEDYAAIRIAAMKHTEFMGELELRHVEGAREREVKIATSAEAPYINKVVTPIIGLSVIGLSFILFAVLIFVQVKPEAKDILIYILGVLSAAVTQILSYYFGSSQGSKDKDKK